MKIIYDISVLGSGHYNNRARTGIFRVVENIARGLAETKEHGIAFCAIGNNLEQCLGYLKANPYLERIPLSYNQKYISIKCKLNEYHSNIKNKSFINSISSRVYFKLTKIYLRYLKRYTNLTEELIGVEDADVFHSPFLPLPRELLKYDRTRRFITIYDIIPIIHPEYFMFEEDHLLKSVVASIDRDTWVLSISESTKNDLCGYSQKVDPDKVVVTPLAASELFYQCSSSKEIACVKGKYAIPDKPYILSCCTLEPRKNIDQTIKCFVTLIKQEHIQDLCLVLVGAKGWDYAKIFDTIPQNQDLKGRIIITGYVADEDLAAIYSGALAFIYPSFYEGFGLPPLEAMKCGIPVITSNTSSLPEVVGDAGIMVNPHDADAICQSMLDLYNNPALRLDLSEKSIKRAELFSWERCVQQTIDAYKKSLN